MNFKEAYLEYVASQTDGAPHYRLPMAYFVVSSVINKNVSMPFGFRTLHPNLYILLIGESTLQRKSWNQGIALDLIRRIHPQIIIGEMSSREAFIAELAAPIEERVPFGCGVWAIDELKGFMDRSKNSQHQVGFIQDLSSLYDGRSIERRKGVGKKETERFNVEHPFFNLTAACSYEWLNQSIERSDIVGGFLARFLWIVCRTKNKAPNPWPKTVDQEAKTPLVEKLERISRISGHAWPNEEAWESWNRWYTRFRVENQGGKWDSSYERLTVIAMKLAMLEAIMRYEEKDQLNEKKIIIEKEDLKTACLFVESVASGFNDIVIGEDRISIKMKKFLKLLIDNGHLSRSEPYKRLYDLKKRDMDQIVETLVDAGAMTVNGSGLDKNVAYYSATETAAQHLKDLD